MLIDTHCHLNFMVKEYNDNLLTNEECAKAKNFIEDAEKNNVKIIINIGTSIVESKNSIMLAKAYKNVFASIGIHPIDISDDIKEKINELKNLLIPENKVVAIGECGIDLYKNKNLQLQKDYFKAQIELALEHEIPIIVHTREAEIETLECLEEYSKENLTGVMHCFTGSLGLAKEAIQMGLCLGIGGKITYPQNDSLRRVIKSIGLNNIILETDAPFLPPQNIRGQKNSPKEIKAIAQSIKELFAVEFKDVEVLTTALAKKVFNLTFQV